MHLFSSRHIWLLHAENMLLFDASDVGKTHLAIGRHDPRFQELEGPPIHGLVELEVDRPDVMGILSS